MTPSESKLRLRIEELEEDLDLLRKYEEHSIWNWEGGFNAIKMIQKHKGTRPIVMFLKTTSAIKQK